MKIAEDQGYRTVITNIEDPEIDFTNRQINIKEEDLTVYHMVHEVAHIFIGPQHNTRQGHLNEALAETISVRVRQEFGYEVTEVDDAYILNHLAKSGSTPASFARREGQVQGITQMLIDGIRREYDAYRVIGGRSGVSRTYGKQAGSFGSVSHKSCHRVCTTNVDREYYFPGRKARAS